MDKFAYDTEFMDLGIKVMGRLESLYEFYSATDIVVEGMMTKVAEAMM